jgi:hypothetical protein
VNQIAHVLEIRCAHVLVKDFGEVGIGHDEDYDFAHDEAGSSCGVVSGCDGGKRGTDCGGGGKEKGCGGGDHHNGHGDPVIVYVYIYTYIYDDEHLNMEYVLICLPLGDHHSDRGDHDHNHLHLVLVAKERERERIAREELMMSPCELIEKYMEKGVCVCVEGILLCASVRTECAVRVLGTGTLASSQQLHLHLLA